MSGVYKIVCLLTGKMYIGSSVNINKRFKNHIWYLQKNKHSNEYLQNAWNKYGEQNFKFEIVEIIHDISKLLIREKWWLDKTKCYKREIGFNISYNPLAPNMGNFIDLTGQKFGRLIVKKQTYNDKCGNTRWLCGCDCGKEVIVRGFSLREGHTKSCGCLQKEIATQKKLKHGHTSSGERSKTHHAWNDMLQRCKNKNHPQYKNYGGRNPPIVVCDNWDPQKGGSFENFLKDMGISPRGLSLHIINNHDGYFKENCNWITSKERARNRRSNVTLIYGKDKLCEKDMAEKYKIDYGTLRNRLNKGMSIEEALKTPARKRKSK